MTPEVPLALLAAHFLADVVLQTRKTVERKRDGGWRRCLGFLGHGLVHALCTIALLFGNWTSPALAAGAIVVLAHLAIDLCKSALERSAQRHNLRLFLCDQALHLAAILAACLIFDPSMPALLAAGSIRLTDKARILGAAATALAATWGVGRGIRFYFLQRENARPDRETHAADVDAPGAGRGNGVPEGGFTIGVLERMIIILALLLRQEGLIGFLLAVKSIARFKKFDDDRFIEYFIIGSSLSLLAAILAGLAIGRLLAQWM